MTLNCKIHLHLLSILLLCVAMPVGAQTKDQKVTEAQSCASCDAPLMSTYNDKIVFLGAAVNDIALNSEAFIEDRQTKGQTTYRLGDETGAGIIVEIKRNGIIVSQDGKRTLIARGDGPPSSKSSSPAPAGPNKPGSKDVRVTSNSAGGMVILVDRQLVKSATTDITKLLTQARAVPELDENKKTTGFKIDAIVSGSLYEAIKLQNNDVIKTVNGTELNNPSMVITLFQQLQSENKIKLEILRGGQKMILDYEIR